MSDPRPRRPTLLIIDDDRPIRRLLTRIAERAGFDVDTAKDGIQAMEMMARKTFDIAIVDLMMPRLSGYDLIEKMSTLVPRPTVLVATALMNGDVAHLDDSMVRRVIKKPFDINAVAGALIETAREIAAKRTTDAAPPMVIAEPPPVVVPKANLVAGEGKKPERPEDVPRAGTTPSPLPPPKKIE